MAVRSHLTWAWLASRKFSDLISHSIDPKPDGIGICIRFVFVTYNRSVSTQSRMDSKDRLNLGIEENLLRISVGLEGVECLIRDLDQALTKAVTGLEESPTLSLPGLPSSNGLV